jgi:hypothetical protein
LFGWKGKQQKTFDLFNGKLLSTLVLWLLNFAKPFKVHMDANGFAISRVLMQKEHPISFENKKLAGARLKWLIHENELLW